jgi:uncharacterized repeat protein (TIGR01451 family)
LGLAHVTAADNNAPTFLYVNNWGEDHSATVTLSNTLLVSFTNGFVADEPGTGDVLIRHTRTLAERVTNLHVAGDGNPELLSIDPLTGDPMLDGTHHLLPGSAAIDAGLDAGLTVDLHADFRPQGTAPDVGADEFHPGSVSPAEVVVSGPYTTPGQVSTLFTATVTPVTATAPFTYVWQAEGGLSEMHSMRGTADSVNVIWDTPGDKTITATATNLLNTVVGTHTVHVVGVPVLAIGKSGPPQALVGAPITYTLTVTNTGVEAASSLLISDRLPTGAHYVTGGTLVGDEVRWDISSLAANGGTTQVSFVITSAQSLVNDDYRVIADGGYAAIGAESIETTVGVPDLSISKQGPYSAGAGEPVVYELSVTNSGTVAATNLLIADTLPAGASYVSGGTLVGDEVRWTVDSLAENGDQILVGFVVSADATITNEDFGVTADGGFGAVGGVPVVTLIGGGTRYVAPGGTDGLNLCTDRSAPCATLQHAVSAARDGDEIRVAAGTYTGVQMAVDNRTGYTYTQVVYIDKSVTMRGGYDAGAWSAQPDPTANPTVIDAERAGRGISIVGLYNEVPEVTVDGFTITGGDYTGLHNEDEYGYDRGGGLCSYYGKLLLVNSRIVDNVGGRGEHAQGGGMYILLSSLVSARIENTVIISNSSAGNGGGLYVAGASGPLTITHSTIQENVAGASYGGMTLESGNAPVTIVETDFVSNTAQSYVGGVYIQMSSRSMLDMERVRFQNNRVRSGTAALKLYASGATPEAKLTNVLFAGNQMEFGDADDAVMSADGYGTRLSLGLAHVTAADNNAPTFLYVNNWGEDHSATVTLSNTLLVSFTNGFVADEPGTGDVLIRHTRTLTDNVTNLHVVVGGEPELTAIASLTGDPKLDASYHLQSDSAAIDAGVDVGVAEDIDGDARPQGSAPDIGADEFFIQYIYLPSVLRSQ